MRLTIDQNDPDFDDAKNWNAKVFLNGSEVKMCVEADDTAGYIKRYKVDKAGNVVIQGDDVVYEKVYGKVEIKLNARK